MYALDADRVLRRYRDGGETAGEAAVMTYVADRGVPVPRVHHASGPDMVLERVPGPSLLAALLAGSATAESAATLLADLHHRLHGIPAQRSDDPETRIVHLDLHPDNVILGPAGPVLIDWRNATESSPDLDLAVSALIFAEVAVGQHRPPDLAELAAALLRAFLRLAGGDPVSQLDAAVARRAADPNLTKVEKEHLGRAASLVRVG